MPNNDILKEKFMEPFAAKPFLEKLAYSSEKIGERRMKEAVFINTKAIKDAFEVKIEQLKALSDSITDEIQQAYEELHTYRNNYEESVSMLVEKSKEIDGEFRRMEERVHHASDEVTNVGLQLQRISGPSQRALETINLIQNLNYFLDLDTEPASFKNHENLHKSTMMMHSIVSIMEDLTDPKFDRPKKTIQSSYNRLITEVNKEFAMGYRDGNFKKMKNCADTLMPSKEFHTCYNMFINLCVADFVESPHTFFNSITTTFSTGAEIINRVFISSQRLVMNNFIQQIFELIIKVHILNELARCQNNQLLFLETLKSLYNEVLNIEKFMIESDAGIQASAVEIHIRAIFGDYLTNYINIEIQQLKCSYRETINQTGIEQYLPKNIFSGIGFNSSKIDVSSILMDSFAVSMIQDNRNAIHRCEIMSAPLELASNIFKIYDVLIDYLMRVYCTKGLELALLCLPPINPKSRPSLDFFKVVEQITVIFLFFQKHFSEMVVKHIGVPPHLSSCMEQIRTMKTNFEAKVGDGIDKLIMSYINWIRHTLLTHQTPSDFTPSEPEIVGTGAMQKASIEINYFLDETSHSLEGINSKTVIDEFAMRFVKMYLEHMHSYVYTAEGAMIVGWDISEYAKLFNRNNSKIVVNVFSILDSLVDFLTLHPDNIKELLANDTLNFVDPNLIQSIIGLREDRTSIKTRRLFK